MPIIEPSIVMPSSVSGASYSNPFDYDLARMDDQLKQYKRQIKQINTQILAVEKLKKLLQRIQNSPDYTWLDSKMLKQGHDQDLYVVAGEGKDAIHICRASYRGGVHPGQYQNDHCTITYHYKAYQPKQFEVLSVGKKTRAKLQWFDQRGFYRYGVLPRFSPQQTLFLPIGYEEGHSLYACRLLYQTGVKLGKVVSGACDININGKEQRMSTYQVLGIKQDPESIEKPSLD